MSPVPDLYIVQDPYINAMTIGSENPLVVLHSKTVDCLTVREMEFILGHEVGHIKSLHGLYHMMAGILFPIIGDIIAKATLGIGSIAATPIQLALSAWSRKSEYTADRAGLLACQDKEAAITAMMKIAGAPESGFGQLDAEKFLVQARQFQDFDENRWNAVIKTLSILGSSHPWTVMRAKEMDRWTVEGHYDKLLARRGVAKDQAGGPLLCKNDACRNILSVGAKFCDRCGSKVN
jgi:Zn-dependent protease with chaperone function